MSSDIVNVNCKEAPPALGPYSHAVKAAGQIFVSGCIPFNAEGQEVGTTITEKTEQICQNISAILKEAGSSMQRVVKVNVFLADMKDFGEMNAVYEKYFAHKPARSCVAVAQLPKNVPVEIECIALQ
ncbi:hypothetical protein KEM56_000781 [Ascosphaera pollenicola]|nr:hypothetical protein KEM56_000781 [Ascosphaera pollenicola]